MRRPLLFLLLVLLGNHSFAQIVKRVVKDSLKFREKYDVLKSEPAVKQGFYELSVRSGAKIRETGNYKDNKREGIWHVYDDNGLVIVEGHYKEGQKVDEWKYFDNLWKLANVYDFTKKELTYHLPTKIDSVTNFSVVIKPRDTLVTLLDRAPVYLGGDVLMFRALFDNLVPPNAALQAGFFGKTIVGFTIDANGQVKDYYFARSAGYDCDVAAIKAVKMIPNSWLPGRKNGKNVAVVMRLPVVFDFRNKK